MVEYDGGRFFLFKRKKMVSFHPSLWIYESTVGRAYVYEIHES